MAMGTDLAVEDRRGDDFGAGFGEGEAEGDGGDGGEERAEPGAMRGSDGEDRGNAGERRQGGPGPAGFEGQREVEADAQLPRPAGSQSGQRSRSASAA